ncbi:MAG: S41 family peptidase [Chitinophagaceae bacterium]
MKAVAIVILLWCCMTGSAQSYTSKQYKEDFEFFWNSVNDKYCYFNKKKVDWNKVKEIYASQIDTVTSRSSFVTILEHLLYELYDHHCSLNTNTDFSRRLVPTGADLWAEYNKGKPVITEVRKDFGAEVSGIMAGMEVVAINDVPVENAISQFLAHTNDIEAKSFALRLVLAGDHLAKRKITLKHNGVTTDFYPDKERMLLENTSYKTMVETNRFGNIGYIRINNCLFDNDLIPRFDSALNQLMKTNALILDLRETASGGNSSVARAIISRFITKEGFYQKHEYYAEEKETGIKRSWEEIVSPRGITYTKPLVILADHWTGSMGEGITIGFDAMKRATVIGTPLARLIGATETFEMPNTKIRFNFPTERLYHINGLPRELFEPRINVDITKQTTGKDPILIKALSVLATKK